MNLSTETKTPKHIVYAETKTKPNPRELMLDDFVDVKKHELQLKPQDPKTVPRSNLRVSSLARYRSTDGGRVQGRARRRTGQRGKRLGTAPRLPPELQASVIVGHTFRFYSTQNITSQNVTVSNLLGICGSIGTITNSTVSLFASAVKLRRVTIWSAEVSSTGLNPQVEFPASLVQVADRNTIRSLPTGITATGPVSVVPRPDTLSSMWQSTDTSSVMFVLLNVPTGSILDIEVSFSIRNNFAATTVGVTTAVQNSVYYLGLDGGTGHIVPIGLPTTT